MDYGNDWGYFGFVHVIGLIAYGAFALIALAVVTGLVILLVRFLLVGTKAAQLYLATNSPARPASPAPTPPGSAPAEPDARPAPPVVTPTPAVVTPSTPVATPPAAAAPPVTPPPAAAPATPKAAAPRKPATRAPKTPPTV